MSYKKDTIIAKLHDLSPIKIYRDPIVNYKGTTTDTHVYYTEVIAQEILTHNLLDGIAMISRTSNYRTDLHKKDMEVPTSNRKEEILAIQLFKNCDEVIDYQVPLKNTQDDDAGKIDLLLYLNDSLVLGELKIEGSEETLLRTLLEVESYHRIVDKEKLKRDFGKSDCSVKKAILIFEDSRQYRDLTAADMPHVKKMLKLFEIDVYIISGLEIKPLP